MSAAGVLAASPAGMVDARPIQSATAIAAAGVQDQPGRPLAGQQELLALMLAAWGLPRPVIDGLAERHALASLHDNALYFIDLGCTLKDIVQVGKAAVPEAALAIARNSLPILLPQGVTGQTVLRLAGMVHGPFLLKSLVSHLKTLMLLGFDLEQILGLFHPQLPSPLRAVTVHTPHLLANGVDHAQICELARSGSQFLSATADFLPSLLAPGMGPREVATAVLRCLPSRSKAMVRDYLTQLLGLGLRVERVCLLINRLEAREHLPRWVECLQQLRKWRLDEAEIGRVLDQHAAIAELEQFIRCGEALRAWGIGPGSLRALVCRADAQHLLPHVPGQAQALLASGFSMDQIAQIACQQNGLNTLQAIRLLPWNGLCGASEMTRLALRPRGAVAIEWFLNNHAGLRSNVGVPAIVEAACRWADGMPVPMNGPG